MNKIIKAILINGILLTSFLALAGCNTAEGVGEDLEDLGDAIQEEAN